MDKKLSRCQLLSLSLFINIYFNIKKWNGMNTKKKQQQIEEERMSTSGSHVLFPGYLYQN